MNSPGRHSDGRLASSVSARDLVYIGDAPTDLQAASAAGALAAAASWGHLYDPQAPADLTLEGPEDALGLLSR